MSDIVVAAGSIVETWANCVSDVVVAAGSIVETWANCVSDIVVIAGSIVETWAKEEKGQSKYINEINSCLFLLRFISVSFSGCTAETFLIVFISMFFAYIQCESKKSPLRFSDIFSRTVGNF